ncbi:MAG: DNA ligase D [Betaproteobacteria bacterium]
MATADPLSVYNEKRDFGLTPEPAGVVAQNASTLSFVIQRHAARALHYDVRLELDGTLKSWAVPKGPSLDPAQKRMAVRTEDHPLSYATFEGVIPPKQYGAGTMIVWDRGTWEPVGDPRDGLAAGKLKFRLHGEKLNGGWTLVRIRSAAGERQEPWLLIKERDDQARPSAEYSVVDALPESVLSGSAATSGAVPKTSTKVGAADQAIAADEATPPVEPPAKGASRAARAKTAQRRVRGVKKAAGALDPAQLPGARPAAIPLTLAPQLATLVEHPPESSDWRYEIKYDGYRVVARIDKDSVHLFTRNGNDWTSRMRGVASALEQMHLAPGWLDGEVVVLGDNGTPDFGALQNAFDNAHTDRIQYFVFDIPYYDGIDLRGVPLIQRRALLADVLRNAESDKVRLSEDFEGKGSDILRNACGLGLEGVIGKRSDSEYVSRRASTWIKLKCSQRQEFVIVGYSDPQGSRTGIGALLLGIYDSDGKLRYAGRVGTGFDTATLTALKKKLDPLAVDKSPLFEKPKDATGNWVKPKLVAEVSFAAWTRDGKVRHAVFHGLRTDKPPAAITRETVAVVPETPATSRRASSVAVAKKGKPANGKPGDAAEVDGVRVSHPERIIDPSTGLTKLDLVNYYAQVAGHILPHLVRRPVALVRAPSGIDHQLFFQKHGDTLKIPALKQLDQSLDPEHPPLLEIDSAKALLGATQMNVVELHTWNSTTRNIDKPDRMTFDLDPGEGLEWPQMIEAAQLVHAVLEELGLISFLKTSGGKGLHVVVPLTPRDDWDTVKNFSREVVEHMARVIPARFAAKSGPRNRVGRIYIDYLRNGRGATTATAFSARARPGMGVSMPCSWKELPALTGGAQWTIVNAHERLDKAEDPWRDYARTKQTLTAAKKKLGKNAGLPL